MSDAISAISSQTPASTGGLDSFARNAMAALEREEGKIRQALDQGLAPSGPLMSMPRHVQDQFTRWENEFTSPEDLKMVDRIKKRVTELTAENQSYIRDRVSENSDRLRLELAMKAVSKTTQGLQQLLSSQ